MCHSKHILIGTYLFLCLLLTSIVPILYFYTKCSLLCHCVHLYFDFNLSISLPLFFLVPLSFSSFLSLSLAKASAKLKASHLVVAFKASETSLRKRLAEELRKCCCKKIISEKPDNTWSTFRPPSQRTNKINEKRERKPRRPIL